MSSADVETVTKMLESLPESVQEQVIDHMREYIANLHDELEWNASFKRTESQLVEAARRAKQEMAEGKAEPMDYEQL